MRDRRTPEIREVVLCGDFYPPQTREKKMFSWYLSSDFDFFTFHLEVVFHPEARKNPVICN